MRIVQKLVPMQFVIPDQYHIEVKLSNDQSYLLIDEIYPQDTPEEVLDRTINVAEQIFTGMGIVQRVSEYRIKLEIHGNEHTIIQSLLGEMDVLRECLSSNVSTSY